MDIAKKIAKGSFEDLAVASSSDNVRRHRNPGLSRAQKRGKRYYNKVGRREATALAFKDD